MTDLQPDVPASPPSATDVAPPAARRPPPARRRFTGAILFGLLVAAIALHILIDQFTPYSSEATVQAPVIGVAPNISGTIVEVSSSRTTRPCGRTIPSS